MFLIEIEYMLLTMLDLDILKRVYKDITGEIVSYRNSETLQEIQKRRAPFNGVTNINIGVILKLRLNYVDSIRVVMDKLPKQQDNYTNTNITEWSRAINDCFRTAINNKFIQYRFKRPKNNLSSIQELIIACTYCDITKYILQITDTILIITDETSDFMLTIDIYKSKRHYNIQFNLNDGFNSLTDNRIKFNRLNELFNNWKRNNYSGNFSSLSQKINSESNSN